MNPPSNKCAGHCVPEVGIGFWGPTLLWTGPIDHDVPACPFNLPYVGWRGYADLLVDPLKCPACACDPPAGECGPITSVKVLASPCDMQDAAVSYYDFAPPAGWDGQCTTKDAIPAGVKCDGLPCVRAVKPGKLSIKETPCTPHTVTPVERPAPINWQTAAIACGVGVADFPMCDDGRACIPDTSGMELAFSTCILAYGDQWCPSTWPVKHSFYGGFEDTRDCAACSCELPEGGSCKAMISIYQDSVCGSKILLSNAVTSYGEYCADIGTGVALGSKECTPPVYHPGACAPHGGELTGGVGKKAEVTLCCLAP